MDLAAVAARLLDVRRAEVLDAYIDRTTGQLVVRLIGYRRRRLAWSVGR